MMDRRRRNVMDRRRLILIILTLAMMAFIFIQSALPGEVSGSESNVIVQILAQITGADPESLSFGVRKAAHFTEYMILGGLLMMDAAGWRRRTAETATTPAATTSRAPGSTATPARPAGPQPTLARLACAWLVAALYAVSDEIHQYFVPERACALMDMGIDSAGAAAGVLIVYFIYRKNRKITRT